MTSVEEDYEKLLAVIAANIKQIRKLKKLTQKAMEKNGFDLRNYQRLEQGTHSPSLYTLHRLAIAFEVKVEDFFKN